jgi:K+-transporting ATPase A subunit
MEIDKSRSIGLHRRCLVLLLYGGPKPCSGASSGEAQSWRLAVAVIIATLVIGHTPEALASRSCASVIGTLVLVEDVRPLCVHLLVAGEVLR